ncbi:MAG: alpha/beta hydrolase, partial [Betaproteobacteria bacterium]
MLAILAGALAACAQPGSGPDALAANAGLVRIEVNGQAFRHLAYAGAADNEQGPVWVFIEGDGIPWIDETIPAVDPTPRAFVALAMMGEAPRPALYLGRPCYLGLAATPPCA